MTPEEDKEDMTPSEVEEMTVKLADVALAHEDIKNRAEGLEKSIADLHEKISDENGDAPTRG